MIDESSFAHERRPQPEVLVTPEEIDFLLEVGRGREYYLRTVGVARRLGGKAPTILIGGKPRPQQPGGRAELGSFEFETSSLLARQFGKLIDQAISSGDLRGTEANARGSEVVVAVLDKGEHRWLSQTEYRERLEQGTEGLQILSVVANIEGDDPDGPVILVRNDMDALQMATGEIEPMCGHNVHSGWAVGNVGAIIEYKRKFGHLPFKRAVFVSEANEEAYEGAGDLVAPRELLKGGFAGRYGNIDIAVGAHVISFVPENHVMIEEGMFHGASDYVMQVRPTESYNPTEDADLRLIPTEVARLVNQQFGADNPNPDFGNYKLVRGITGVVPDLYVRSTAVQEATDSAGQEYGNLALNSLPKDSTYQGKFVGQISRDDLQNLLGNALAPWRELGFSLEGAVDLQDDGTFSISVAAPSPTHVALGGPNPRQILGEILHSLQSRGKIIAEQPTRGLKFGGTARIKTQDYEEVEKQTAGQLREILQQAIRNLGLEGKVDFDFRTQGVIGPVVSDPNLVAQARSVAEAGSVPMTDVGLPHAGAESFDDYKLFFGDNPRQMFYLLIGGLKEDEAEDALETGKPFDMTCMHHAAKFRVTDAAVPYGVLLDLLTIQYARDWKRKKQAGQ